MDSVSTLLLSSTGQVDENAFLNVANSCQELNCFSESESLGKLSRATNSFLNSIVNRHKAFQLMKVHLKASKGEEKTSNIVQWMNQSLKDIAKDTPDVVAVECFELMVTKSNDVPEMRKEVAASIMPRFFDSFRDRNVKNTPPVLLKCLDTALRKYGKGSITFKGPLENFLLSALDVPHLVEESSKCFVSLCLLGPPGTGGENYNKSWLNAHRYLINSMNHLLNRMFSHVPEIQNFSALNQFETGPIRKIVEKDPLVKMVRMSDRLVALSKYLSAMLLVEFPAQKEALVNAIFNVASRILSVQANTLATTPSGETIALITQIPKLHISALSLLEALILSCRKDLFWQANMICKLPCQTLKWTASKKVPYGENKPYNELRAAAYQLLETWLVVQRATSLTEKFSEELIPAFISDFSYSKPAVTISCASAHTKGKMRKSHVSSAQVKEEINSTANKQVTQASLRCLQQYIRATANALKPQVHKSLQEEVLKLILAVQKVECSSWPPPYLDVGCRLELYKTLLALILNHHPNFPPPINYAIPIFRDGLKDSSIEIVSFCSSALSVVEVIVRPFVSTIRLPSNPAEEIAPACLTSQIEESQPEVANIKVNGMGRRSPLPEIEEENDELPQEFPPNYTEESETEQEEIQAPDCSPAKGDTIDDSHPPETTPPASLPIESDPPTGSEQVDSATSIPDDDFEMTREEVDLTQDTESDGQAEENGLQGNLSRNEVVDIADDDEEIHQNTTKVSANEDNSTPPPSKRPKMESSNQADLEEKEMLASFVDLVDDEDEEVIESTV